MHSFASLFIHLLLSFSRAGPPPPSSVAPPGPPPSTALLSPMPSSRIVGITSYRRLPRLTANLPLVLNVVVLLAPLVLVVDPPLVPLLPQPIYPSYGFTSLMSLSSLVLPSRPASSSMRLATSSRAPPPALAPLAPSTLSADLYALRLLFSASSLLFHFFRPLRVAARSAHAYVHSGVVVGGWFSPVTVTVSGTCVGVVLLPALLLSLVLVLVLGLALGLALVLAPLVPLLMLLSSLALVLVLVLVLVLECWCWCRCCCCCCCFGTRRHPIVVCLPPHSNSAPP